MTVQLLHQSNKNRQPKQNVIHGNEEISAHETPTTTQSIINLQRLVGNQGLQRMLAEGKIQRMELGLPMIGGLRNAQPQVQRQCTCGNCNGIHHEDDVSNNSKSEAKVQRFSDSDDDNVNEIPPPEVNVECQTEEYIGHGSGKGVSVNLHGKTVPNYNQGQPMPKPFPSGITVTTGTVNKQKVFSASGSFDVTFKAKPTITLPKVPGGLSECQTEAVKNFINGDLAAHEQDHADAYTDNYDGVVSIPISYENIADTPDMRKRAIETPASNENVSRINTANAASANLDPWNKTIEGLDCDNKSE